MHRSILSIALVAAGLAFSAATTALATDFTTGPYVTDVQVDPYTGRLIVRTNQNVIGASALDPYRNVIDPGSLQFVNRLEYDPYGRPVRVIGRVWTSFGVPHADLRRTVVTVTPGNGFNNGAIVQQNTIHTYRSLATGVGR